jgi:hypothetical protein
MELDNDKDQDLYHHGIEKNPWSEGVRGYHP